MDSKERWKKYFEANKEKIRARQNEKLSCDCGSTFVRSFKLKHGRTKKHQDWENSQNHPVVHVTSKPIEEIVQEVVQILKDRGYT